MIVGAMTILAMHYVVAVEKMKQKHSDHMIKETFNKVLSFERMKIYLFLRFLKNSCKCYPSFIAKQL